MSLYEDRRDRMPAVPRPWAAMFVTWTSLLDSLCAIVGAHAGMPMIEEASAAVWRWMLTLPACSEARKAAFTLGYAAMMIERWRAATEAANRGLDDGSVIRVPDAMVAIGQRAELLLRIAGWHIDDARAEALIRARDGRERPIPAHERVYAHLQAVDPERGGVNFCGLMNDSDRRRVTLAMLDDFVRHAIERKTLKPNDDALIALAPALVETLGASLPGGRWIVTSQDVWRFLAELLPEEK